MSDGQFKTYMAVFEPSGLQKRGPWVMVDITLPESQTGQMPFVRTRAVIDTGAGFSGIAKSVVAKLDLQPIFQDSVASLHSVNVVSFYNVQFTIVGSNFNVPSLRVCEIGDFRQGLGMLLGRDFLARVLFVYDGGSGTFSITLHDDHDLSIAPDLRIEKSLRMIKGVLSGQAEILPLPK